MVSRKNYIIPSVFFDLILGHQVSITHEIVSMIVIRISRYWLSTILLFYSVVPPQQGFIESVIVLHPVGNLNNNLSYFFTGICNMMVS